MQFAIIPKLLLLIPLLTFEVNLAAAQSNGNFQNALSLEPFSFIMPSQIDTLYYPFYQGLQMIEVDHIGYWDLKIFFLEQSQPRAMPHSMFHPMPLGNEYFFRDSTGTIVKAFNTPHDLATLTKQFQHVPLNSTGLGNRGFMPIHQHAEHRAGIWYQSPQSMFDFSGHFKVFSDHASSFNSPIQNQTTETNHSMKFGLIDSMGVVIIPMEYGDILPFYHQLLVQKEGKWGVIDYENHVVVPLQYDRIVFDDYASNIHPEKLAKLLFLTTKDQETDSPKSELNAVLIPESNTLLRLGQYDEPDLGYAWSSMQDENKRFIPITKNGKKGLLNEAYQEVVPPQFDLLEIHLNAPRLYRVSRNGRFGFWDKEFKEVIPLEYDYVEDFQSDSTALVFKDGAFYRIDAKNRKKRSGNQTPQWEIGYLNFVTNPHFICVETGQLQGIVDTLHKTLMLPIAYPKPLTPIRINSFVHQHQALLKERNIAMSKTPDMIDELLFQQNRIIVKNDQNRFGVMDSTFQLLIDFKYEHLEAIPCELNYLLYTRNGKTGVMDFAGKDHLKEDYDEIRYDIHYQQERDIFKVKKGGKWGVINFQNETLLPFAYDSITFLGHWNRPKVKLWVVKKDNRCGVVDEHNQIFIPFDYPGISHLEGNNLWVEGEDKKRYRVVISE